MSEKLLGKVSVPEGKKNNISIEKFTVSKMESGFSIFSYGPSRIVEAGEYTRLMFGKQVIMSDTSNEIRDHFKPIIKAKGKCLVAGLGIGVVLQALLRKKEVEFVTVVEKSQDVIDLVEPHYRELFGWDKFEIICADIFYWKPPKGVKYEMAWYDIWFNICSDNLPEMHKLHRKFGNKTSWQGSWCRGILERKRRIEKREEKLYMSYRNPFQYNG